jgi:HAD superfamily hydrolase (TIGR01509 family)
VAAGRAIEGVVFDLDGVLLASERVWNAAKEEVTREHGGAWRDDAPSAMMGMSSLEWSRYMHDVLGVPLPPEEIDALVVERMRVHYEEQLPLLPGAVEAVESLAARWPLALASSSNRPVIDLALELSGLAPCFRVTLSSEEVARGKPAPDVYLEAARRLGVQPDRCAADEDSAHGFASARAAGMRVVAVPNPAYPPGRDALAQADLVLGSVAELRPELLLR